MLNQSVALTNNPLPKTASLSLVSALKFPFQTRKWFARLLPLALAQLLPVFGQLILLGYGVQIVRAIHSGQSDLPRIQWLPAFGDGLKVAVTGFIFMIPVFLTGLLVLAGGGSGENPLTFPLLLILSIAIAPVGNRLQKSESGILRLFGRLVGLFPLLITILTVIAGLSSFIAARNNPVPVAASAPQIGLPILITGAILIFVIFTATLVGAVRLGITNNGIFDAPGTAKLLAQHGRATGMLVLNMLFLLVITFVATGVGLLLLIVPGLLVLVACSAAAWHLLTQFGINIGIEEARF